MNKQENTQKLFAFIIDNVKQGKLVPKVCAKSVCVDAREVKPEEVGTKFTVWSHGKVEKEVVLTEDMMLLTTLDENGNPVVDSAGHLNVYDMKKSKFQKTYPKQINGHYVKDPYDKGSVAIVIEMPAGFVPEEGITILPPNWGGYEGTLMQGGVIMMPFNPERSLEGQIWEWENNGANGLDWYPNNEPNTYSECDKNGTFKNPALRKTFGQTKEYEGYPYSKKYEQ